MFNSLYRRIVLVAAGIVLAHVIGCGRDFGAFPGDPPSPGPQPPAKRAETLIGYGLVNHWQLPDPQEFADLLYVNGLTLTEIEYTDTDPQNEQGGLALAPPIDDAVAFVTAMRSRGVTTFINFGNWNNGEFRKQEDGWFNAGIDALVALVGPELVILGAVSEPAAKPKNDGKTRRWTRYAADRWPGLFAQSTQDGEAYFGSVRHDYLDEHNCSDERLLKGLKRGDSRTLQNTDCRPILDPGPERAATFTRAAIDHEANLLIYAYSRTEVNVATIEAMGAEIQK